MYVFLPDEQTGLDQFEQDLTPENWDGWMPPPPFVMKVDRPFFFAIRDNQTGLILFMGSVRNPV